MKNEMYVRVSGIIFLIVGVVHAARSLYGWEANIGAWMVPMWVSWAATVIALFLASAAWRLAR